MESYTSINPEQPKSSYQNEDFQIQLKKLKYESTSKQIAEDCTIIKD